VNVHKEGGQDLRYKRGGEREGQLIVLRGRKQYEGRIVQHEIHVTQEKWLTRAGMRTRREENFTCRGRYPQYKIMKKEQLTVLGDIKKQALNKKKRKNGNFWRLVQT